jgi:hypothetical protein
MGPTAADGAEPCAGPEGPVRSLWPVYVGRVAARDQPSVVADVRLQAGGDHAGYLTAADGAVQEPEQAR